MIVATAGHIDHGKTTLVKALTGVDTDRLPEEKARGISIDLGFAYWQPADAPLVGFVDVPGHERFVRNMLAGVCGIDCALLVVAADDGVMPQTREHLQILDLLAVGRGAAVITKADRVDAARVADVVRDVRALLAPTALAGADVLPVSAVTGEGLQRLRELLEGAAATVRRDAGQGRRLRHAIDRVFTVAGTGTVVTGTVFEGEVATGDVLTLTPSGKQVRVRGVQMHGAAVARGSAGERCAISVAGVAVGDVQRGDWLVDPALHAPTQRLDVHLRVLESEPGALRHWTPVHLHLGTRDVTGRVAMRRGAAIEPGGRGLAQLVLDQPIAALAHDRFILRDQSAQRTIAGGLVLDPWPPRQRVRPAERAAQLEALAHADVAQRLCALAAATPGGADATAFARAANLDESALAELLRRRELVALGREPMIVLPRSAVESLTRAVGDAIERFHREQPQAVGIDLIALRREAAPALAPPVFEQLLRRLAQERRVEIAGALVRRPGHASTDHPADQRLWQLVQPLLCDAGLGGITVPQLAAQARVGEPVLRGLLQRRAHAGQLVRVTPDRFYLRGTMAVFAAVASCVAQAAPEGRFHAGAFRDRSGVGRALAVEVLESLDRLGITQRVGDVRLVRRDFVPVLGPASAPPSVAKAAPRPTMGDRRHVR